MKNSLDMTVVGNVEISGKTLRNFLKKSFYFLSYEPETRTAELFVNHLKGAESLITLRNVDYEVAKKLAKNLGLSAEKQNNKPLLWEKWNPLLELDHDGSPEAEKLRIEMLRLGIPHIVNENSQELSLIDSPSRYNKSSFTVEEMMKVVQGVAERYKEQITTVP